MTALQSSQHVGFVHEVAFYDGPDRFLDCTVPFVNDGLAAGEAVFVAVTRRHLQLLVRELGQDDRLELLAMEDIGTNPAWIIPAWAAFLERQGDGRPVRGLAEPVWADRSEEELVECDRHEALLNVAFSLVVEFRLRCVYDISSLPSHVIDAAVRTHPHTANRWRRRRMRRHVEPEPLLTLPLAPAPSRAGRVHFDGSTLRAARAAVRRAAEETALAEQTVDDLCVAVSELLCNSVQHGGGEGELVFWAAGARFYCEVRDKGTLHDPLAGRRRPLPTWESGRGLWLVHQLCDLVQMRATPDGLQIRLQVH